MTPPSPAAPSALLERLGVDVDPELIELALTHRSYAYENGEIAHPVSEATIAGNLAEMFLHLTPADDLQFRDARNAPTCLVEGMTIAGR